MSGLTKWFAVLATSWAGAATLVVSIAAAASLARGSDDQSTVSVETFETRIVVEANSAPLEEILTTIGFIKDFEVVNSYFPNEKSVVNGKWEGNLEEVLKWLLYSFNHVRIYGVDIGANSDAGTDAGARLLRIILMSPSGGRSTLSSAPSKAHRPGDQDGAAAGRVTNQPPDDRQLPISIDRLAAARGTADRGARISAVGAADIERLSRSGNTLANVLVDPFRADITRTIDLGDDVPIGAYVMAHTAAGPSMQRTPRGDWVPWDGRHESLIDNRFRASNRRLDFLAIGGDSLLAMELIVRAKESLGVEIDGMDLLRESLQVLASICDNSISSACEHLAVAVQVNPIESFFFGASSELYGLFHQPMRHSPIPPVLICAPIGP